MITVVFRYDDYSTVSKTDTEVRIIEVFKKYSISCTFGVVPYMVARDRTDAGPQGLVPLSPSKAEILKNAIESGAVEVALHGYSHQSIGLGPGNSEFRGLKYEEQLERIKDGRRLLQNMVGMQVALFIPPWNTYDLDTLKALEELGLRCICASNKYGVGACSSRLRFLPKTCGPHQLRSAVRAARKLSDPECIIVALFHEYEIEAPGEQMKLTFAQLEQILAWLKSQRDISILSTSQALNAFPHLGAERFLSNKQHFSGARRRLSPGFFSALYPEHLYLTLKTLKGLRFKTSLYLSVFYVAIALAFLFVSLEVMLHLPLSTEKVLPYFRYGTIAILVAASAYALRDHRPSWKDAWVLAALLGLSVGFWVAP
ncbi:MAG TPA: DUF2334 domain-containing protein [bacterium]|nr:DUF2334 domain-containing protein [bacterium]